MRAPCHCASLAILTTTFCVIGQSVSIDRLDAEDGGPVPPAEVLVVDFFVDVARADNWYAAGFGGSAYENARFVYAPDGDPNEPPVLPRVINPGLENPFVTFVSTPRPRFDPDRFENDQATLHGTFCTPTPFSVAPPTRVELVWFTSWSPGDPERDGAMLRVALDVTNTCNPSSATILLGNVPVPDGWVPVMRSTCEPWSQITPGIVILTTDAHSPFGINWGIYVDARPTCGGDANRDGTVDSSDLTLLLSSFGVAAEAPGFSRCSDFDGNGQIDIRDLATLLSAFGGACL